MTNDVISTNARIGQLFLEKPTEIPLAEHIVLQDFAQNCVYQGRQAVEPLLLAFFVKGFSDVQTEKQTVLANEKSAVVQFIFSGRQEGIFLGIPATGKQVTVPMVLVCQIADAHIYHIDWYYDAGTLLRQLKLAL